MIEITPNIRSLILLAINEDIGSGDITTNSIISKNEVAEGFLISKDDGIIAGIPIIEEIYKHFDPNIYIKVFVNDGQHITKGQKIVKLNSTLSALLTAERTALNFLQRMSGIATNTYKILEKIKDLDVKLLDTRKTVPGHRSLDKYSVKTGGGTNHRIGLFDMVMIKDNHISAAKGITNAVAKIRENVDHAIKIEVETTNMTEIKEALDNQVDIIMLDNMGIEEMREAVQFINKKAKIEASGNITINNVRKVAETGIDYISIGALTHSVKALDISQYLV